MMSEDVARAVGAAGTKTVAIAGKQCTVRPLGIRELTEVERDCVARYKRGYLETFAANVDLLPEADRRRVIEEKMEAVARWDVDDLPPKFAYDPARVALTPPLRDWLVANMGKAADGAGDPLLKKLCATALDQGTLSENVYSELSGDAKPPRVKVPYANWWITASYEGMITFIWVCFRHNGVSRDQVGDALGHDMGLLVELSREIERLSVPQVGNA